MNIKEPYVITLETGTHYICQCGQSDNRPLCDGAHKETGKKPFALEIEQKQEVTLCACLQSANLPFCDGSHSKIKTG